MNTALTIKFSNTDRKVIIVLTLFVLTFVILTLIQDILRSGLQNSAFYFSESFMFSSFWWLFAPLLFAQYVVIRHKNIKSLHFKFAVIILPIVVHLFAFPLLVWLLSKTFYYHTYSLKQTFSYTLAQHLYLLVLFYTIPVTAFQYFINKIKPAVAESANNIIVNQFSSTILVADGNKKHHIAVSEILYFSANPPYINIQLKDKRYLHHATLKSISVQLNPQQFVRVHKSTIVNINSVIAYTTRLNGDYDLIMTNNIQLRLSRNFAAGFKSLFNQTHRFTTK
jgi:signal transduction histidine kinase